MEQSFCPSASLRRMTMRMLAVCLCLWTCAGKLFAQETVYELVTDASQLVDGCKYIIVDLVYDKAMGWQDTNNRKPADITGKRTGDIISGITIATSAADHTNVYEFTLYQNKSTKNKWGLYDSANKKFLCAYHLERNGIELKTQNSSSESPVPSECQTTISFGMSSHAQAATIKFAANGNNQSRFVMNGYGDPTNVFACYNVENPRVALYRKRVDVITISEYGYTTYCSKIRFRMPQGCTGYLVSSMDGGASGSLLLTEKYSEDAFVPANTPLLIKGKQGEYPVYQTDRTRSAPTEENLLHADFDAEGNTIYASEHSDEYLYYKLTTKNKAAFGFYWGSADGGPFKMNSPSRAYLVLPRTQSNVKGLVLEDAQIETGIMIPVSHAVSDARTYDLMGRPCQVPLSPGIYVRAGRKFMVR